MALFHRPRIVLAGVSSGVGKTTIVTGLLSLFRLKGLSVQPFKVGPDYIDPGFHTLAAGRPSCNLDTWLVPPERLPASFAVLSEGADLSIIEGVMGLFDGGSQGVSSTADIAKRLKAPVVLVINCQSVGTSAAATALGYREYDKDLHIAGVILNKLGSDKHEAMIRDAMAGIGMPVLGAFHRDDAMKTPERHLGLTPVTETETKHLIASMRDAAAKWTDADALLAIARKAPDLAVEKEEDDGKSFPVTIAVAEDEAFTFYYPTSLKALEERGATLIPFSPLRDKALPEADGVLFGGGFPEMFLTELEENESMKASIRSAKEKGMPIYAECGGLMYLCQGIAGFDGKTYAMAGLVPAVCRMQKKLQRVGYVTGTALRKSILAEAGETLRGHEFHFSTLEGDLSHFPWAYDLQGTRQNAPHQEGYAEGSVLATYLHISFEGNPTARDRYLAACLDYQKQKG